MTRQPISTWIRTVAGTVLFGAVTPSMLAGQSTSEVPRFEAVSVKPCDPDADAGGARGGARLSPNRLFVPCLPVRAIVRLAFLPGQNPRDRDRLVGGPDWLDSERFTIEGVADASVPRATLTGPMFQAVLVERFGLKVRRETRPVRAYVLTPAPRGVSVAGLREGTASGVSRRSRLARAGQTASWSNVRLPSRR